MINLSLKSEYSFKKVFGKVEDVLEHNNGQKYIGIADHNNTFAHGYLEKYCKDNDMKPIFGVRIEVVKNAEDRVRGRFGPTYLFIAKNNSGLKEINELATTCWSKFYYRPMIGWDDLFNISDDVFVIAENFETTERLDYIAVTTTTTKSVLEWDIPKVFIQNNFYSYADDKSVYQILCGTQKRGEGYVHKFESQTYPQHILSDQEFLRLYNDKDCITNTFKIAEQCTAYIPRAPMARYIGDESIESLCFKGSIDLDINIEEGVYADRLQYELDTIKQKDYVDYFLIVSDLIRYAKKYMFVGPGRGSSAGSLICYLIGVTTVDPIRHGLLFERFIDMTREDLPDIDIDFPDNGRDKVIKYLFKKYGEDNVCHISNINKMKAKSAIDEFGKSLLIPAYEISTLKDSIVDRSGGDARAKMAIEDTLDSTDAGKEFIKKYPSMSLVRRVQNHASHFGKHAAGVIVCPDDISKYGGINTRENSLMMDKRVAEFYNLLKIDCLGLRTLSVLEDAAHLSGVDYNMFHSLDLKDEKTYKIFKDMRLHGIFQFEGQAMQMLCGKMGVENFDDIVSLTALARPGPLHSGGADKFIRRRTGQSKVDYGTDNEDFIRITKDTYGVIVFQEQLMNICKDVGSLTWNDVGQIRKAISKALGKHFFEEYKAKFVNGAKGNGLSDSQASGVWETMISFGNWAMNKSHTVSYGLISYWCAYMKAHHPLEFTAANLNHTKNKDSALRILRDAFENEGIEYTAIDADESGLEWTIHDGKLLGGLTNIKGVGEKKAKEIIAARSGKRLFTPSMVKALLEPETDFDYLYPCKEMWGRLYDDPKRYGLQAPPSLIKDVDGEGNYVVVGKLLKKDLRDLNEYNELVKRGGKYLDEDSMFLKMTIEDDTGIMFCSINRFKFERMNGRHFAETGVDDKTWYVMGGKIKGDWKILDLDMIYDLTTDDNEVFANDVN